MKKILSHFSLIGTLNIADLVTISAIIPVITGYYFVIHGNPDYAIISMTIAFFLDTIDGYLARKMHITSDLGMHLDSFVDTLNYLSLTALFVLYFLNINTVCTLFSVFIMISAGILRLSRYNVSTLPQMGTQRSHFIGMPVPYAQLTVVIIYLIAHHLYDNIMYATPVIIVIISFFMISEIKFIKPSNYFFWYLLTIVILCLSIINTLT